MDDLETGAVPAVSSSRCRRWPPRTTPSIRAAQETVRQETYGITAARAEMLPSLSFDYFYGINANQYAIQTARTICEISAPRLQAELSVPIWNWGATRSKVRQADCASSRPRWS